MKKKSNQSFCLLIFNGNPEEKMNAINTKKYDWQILLKRLSKPNVVKELRIVEFEYEEE